MLRKLRIKFIGYTMFIVTLMLFIIFSLIYQFTSRGLEKESLQMMHLVAMTPEKVSLPESTPRQMYLPFFTLRKEGELFLAEGGLFFDLSDQKLLKKLYNAAQDSEDPDGELLSYHLRYLRVPSPSGDYIVFADMSAEKKVLNHLVQDSLVVGSLILFLFFLLSMFLARLVVKPVEHAWNQQKKFIADASHELKTPLSVILTNAQMMRSPDFTPEAKEQLLFGISTVSSQMRELVEQMLELARAENGLEPHSLTRICLSDLLSETEMIFEPMFFENNRVLNSSIAPDLFVRGNKEQLERLTGILLDNAIKYSDENSCTNLVFRSDKKHTCILTVSNSCKKAVPEDTASLFKRFYRKDPSRSRDHSYGLGLSIAQAIAVNHRGKIRCDVEDSTITFSLRLRLSRS